MGVGAGERAAAVAGNSSGEMEAGEIHTAAGITGNMGKKIDGVRIVEKEKREWNTKNIGSRMGVDAACAATAGGLVSPIITMIDK